MIGSGINFNFETKIDKNVLIDFDPYDPEPFQKDIHNSVAKYNILIGAPGMGKTVVGAQEIKTFIQLSITLWK